MASFDVALEKLLQKEGGWCNVPGDKGGETYCGISSRSWPAWDGWSIIAKAKIHESYEEGPAAFSKHLAGIPTLHARVSQFYLKNFWSKACADTMPQALADEMLEQAVNLGVLRAVMFLQKTCNALNFRQGKTLFKDLSIDGVMGAKTLAALDAVLVGHSAGDVLHCLNLQQGSHYIALAAANPVQRKFLTGWLKRTIEENDE